MFMEGHGIYIWTSYAITLGVFVLNVWLAGSAHARNLADAREATDETSAARRPTVRQMQ